MSTFELKISSPDGAVFEGQVVSLFVRGIEGELAVLAGHIPFVTTVADGICRILFEDGNEKKGHAGGGILSVADNKVTLLSGSFEWDKGE
ncbi:MAG: F0F1 ATP synthase subunit epsilon [Clostridia bacterium]|nr:F0F1 ATP synthase subunit epsilon [Clostridia bacterium]